MEPESSEEIVLESYRVLPAELGAPAAVDAGVAVKLTRVDSLKAYFASADGLGFVVAFACMVALIASGSAVQYHYDRRKRKPPKVVPASVDAPVDLAQLARRLEKVEATLRSLRGSTSGLTVSSGSGDVAELQRQVAEAERLLSPKDFP